jgi:hypothetical protein
VAARVGFMALGDRRPSCPLQPSYLRARQPHSPFIKARALTRDLSAGDPATAAEAGSKLQNVLRLGAPAAGSGIHPAEPKRRALNDRRKVCIV